MAILPGFPLLPDSDDDENVVELPSGQLVCCRHALVVCGKCCVDFSFMTEGDTDDDYDDESQPDQESNDEEDPMDLDADAESPQAPLTGQMLDSLLGQPRKRGTGRVLPTKFTPPTPTTTPLALFHGVNTYFYFARYVHREDSSKGLIFTDGACLDNGKSNPRAGWGFVAGPPELIGTYSCGNVQGRLESKGPFGDDGAQTSNRAELRAVCAALGFRHWPGEGFKTLVFATDSEYVVEGATKWVQGWLKNGWKTAKGGSVKNKDLWEMLLGQVERFADYGMKIEFWRIGRELNTVADKLAKEGAAIEDAPKDYSPVVGI
ncbi:ribonuclease H-like protein [Lindgomyces ingoldianus]|uniref:Ribonuclease H-like protein n=1 Tax=Lindgomyces ingoldianus TaxID=673940 RepID=A0ACB6QN45_9PLEO|nr:ribonuclease H-like protein [Lindgomyces ingoldianus]KAF2468331.1 ribonuclease H-like protein [Lindgomyces ingoldianus]